MVQKNDRFNEPPLFHFSGALTPLIRYKILVFVI